ncbi:hypothetical protein Kpol_282p5 [Vanderwaltozyma polyspora DSM 70294]|uniref:RBR-type E3 ubiquitin transferase n=1 Tax=Vanderwaltozyma polyspora (strain ATCC 22028 / DSM 70294 / BCRC 21397 / CBS 2163 / NBRC 10782 / NRRL Y-8283 / UCD 57-17) TaxID=436907 RepID=A7TST1_VANPO|nr:uncharacterized protein Kpol_282p5 [Vanderwaltozyma polyspora DSM 70294]EDO14678.1 hypothetical protein Kpol_282p5 [Vanderwaltozyma polyspora DSM 70294]
MNSDEEYSLVYDDDDDDNDSLDFYEALPATEFAINISKSRSHLSQSSEFDIEEDPLSNDDMAESMLDVHVSASAKRALTEGSVPDLKYECLTTEDIFHRMLKRVDHLQPIFSIPHEDILLLMQLYDWNEERLLEDWTEKMDILLEESGIHVSHNSNGIEGNDKNGNIRGVKFQESFNCIICCEEKSTETFSLECGHEYCIDCYRHYIKDKLNKGNVITCMDCSLALKNDDIDKIMGHQSSNKLMSSSIKSFIQKHNNNYKWCPYTDCKCIIHLKDTSSFAEYLRVHCSPFVSCKSSHRFCFSCGFEIHSPADCDITTTWIKKAKKESENLNWVLSHTKECPKCSVNIEKNGGCNHMACSSCKYEFCWICSGDWKPHGSNFYQCTMYNNEDSKSKTSVEDTSKTLKRYTFYYRMFNEHEASAKLDWQLGQTVENKVKHLQEKIGVSWIEGQFLTESLRALNEGRTALKWSFAIAFYSDPSHNLTKIFVDNQMLLSNSVEDLSELLQIKNPEKIMNKKTDFYNKAGYVTNRTLALIQCGRDLLRKGICKPTN